MRSLSVRVAILVLFVAAAAGSAYLFWMGEARARAGRDAARRFDERAGNAVRGMLELRAAQQAYVAAGQGEQFWIDKVGAAVPALHDAIAALKAEATSTEAQTALGSASDALLDFAKMDKRARSYTLQGQRLLASDLVFSAGLESTASVIALLDQARTAESLSDDDAIANIRRRQLFALGAAAAAASLGLLLLVPRAAPREDLSTRLDERPADSRDTLRLVPDEGWAPAQKSEPQPAAPADPLKPVPSIDLAGIAAVCTDLARIENTQTLPSILQRAAAALDASGIVLWISEPGGQELAPVLAHGYPPTVLSKLSRIPREAENATAAAFRTALLQTVNADVMSEGAIAAPLLSHAGCVGVMAAEVRNEGERNPAMLAAAAIVAAQISTLVGPPPARAPAAEAAGA